MKRGFLNQKLGKRMSRKAELLKAKAALAAARPAPPKTKPKAKGGARPGSVGGVTERSF